jgi:type II secretory pathway pseudopilin PulG
MEMLIVLAIIGLLMGILAMASRKRGKRANPDR